MEGGTVMEFGIKFLKDIDEFVNEVKKLVKKKVGKEYDVEIKNTDGQNILLIHKKDESKTVESGVVLESLHNNHIEGMPLSNIVDIIIDHYFNGLEVFEKMCTFTEADINQIYFKLTDQPRKHEYAVPVAGTDLFKVFYVLREQNDALIFINEPIAEKLGIKLADIEDIATKNTIEDFPVSVMKHSLADVFLVTNTDSPFGANTFLYPGFLEEFSEHLDSDLVIFPSSDFEVLIVPVKSFLFNPDETEKITKEVLTDMSDYKRLSHSIYYFNHETNKLSTCK